MYQQFFQFRRLPFQATPDPHFYFFTTRHEEAFNQGLYAVRDRKGFMVLTGEVGTGKTTLSRLLIEQLGSSRVTTALVFNPNLTTVELLQSINHEFGINDQSCSKKVLTDELNRFLLEQLMQGGNAVLIIDEAQTLSVDCLEEIRLLSNLETPRDKLLQILLIGQPELMDKLALPKLRQLNQRIVVRAHLTPLETQEVADYIQYRLWRAGGREAVHFDPAALKLVYRYSGGVPRLINALCDRALLAAYIRGTRLISGQVMSQVISELTPILQGTEAPQPHLTREEAVIPARTRTDSMLGVATIGLALLVAGLGAMWWNSDSIEQHFPQALLAREQPETVLLPPADFSPGLGPFNGMDGDMETASRPAVSDAAPSAPVRLPINTPRVKTSAPRLTQPKLSVTTAPTVPRTVSQNVPQIVPMMSAIRPPVLPTEVVSPLQPAPAPAVLHASGSAGTDRRTVPHPPVSSAPASDSAIGAASIVLRTDHVDTRVAGVRREVVVSSPAEPAPTTVDGKGRPAWYVDGDDVIRAATPVLRERAALLMLLHQWGAVPDWPPSRPDSSPNADPDALAREHRLELIQVPLSGHELLSLNYPAIVMRKDEAPGQPPRPVVITRTISGRVVMLDPGAGFTALPVSAIDRELTGVVRLYWRPLNGWRWPGSINGQDPVVRWLQRKLREQRLYRGPIDGLVGPNTEQALLQWAGRRGLTVTVADPLMDLLISQLLAPSGFPHLTLHDSGLSAGGMPTGDAPASAAGRAAG